MNTVRCREHHAYGRCVAGLSLALVSLALFSPVLRNDYAWDDNVNITKNPHLNPLTPASAAGFWRKGYEHLYVPLTYTLWALLAWLGRLGQTPDSLPRPGVFHAANLVLHALVAMVVFDLLRLILAAGARDRAAGNGTATVRRPFDKAAFTTAAFAGALLFALHPTQAEPVAWISGAKDLLCGLMAFTALHQYLLWDASDNASDMPTRARGLARYFLALALFVLALAAKPTAVVLPLMAFVLDRTVLRRPWRRSALALLPWLAVSAVWAWYTRGLQPDVERAYVTSLWARPVVALDALAFYLYKLVLPVRLGLDYGRSPQFVLAQPWLALTWIVPAGLAALLWTRRADPLLRAAAALFLLGLLPVLGLVPFGFQDNSTVADRYLYLAMLGPGVAAAVFVARAATRRHALICALVLTLFAVRSVRQTLHWRGNERVFTHALELNPRSALAHYNLGVILSRAGRHAAAATHYSRALAIRNEDPARGADPAALRNLGVTLLHLGDLAGAEARCREAVELDPDSADGHNNLGAVCLRKGEPAQALSHYSRALRLRPDYPETHCNMGAAFKELGNTAAALHHYREALRINPVYADAHNGLGVALAEAGRRTEAMAQFSAALEAEPRSAEAQCNLGFALAEEGRLEDAIAHYSAALRLDPHHARARANLEHAFEQAAGTSGLIARYAAALNRDPNDARAHHGLGRALAREGRIEDAIRHLSAAVRLGLSDANLHNDLAILFGRQDRIDAALAHFSEAVRLNPQFAEAHNNLGIALARNRDLPGAIRHFSEAIRIRPGFEKARQCLATALDEQRKQTR
ncbi:MAG: tetratricopeptide repeat protein [Kiritimatiellae bacterium]|nr:tetratricopeptide repeat protein [Kiritimatiellia bacterium]